MSENAPLFRPESLEARRQAWLGRPTILHNIPTTVFACFSMIFVLAVVLFLVFGEYTRRVRVAGVILPIDGLTRIVAPQAGWVTGLQVGEGDTVRRGEVLYTISIDSTTALGNTQDAVVDVLRNKGDVLNAALFRQSEIDEVEQRSLRTQEDDIEREIVQIDEQVALLEEFTDQMEGFATRQQELVAQGISISREYESRLQAFNVERAQLARLRRDRIQLSARLNEVQNQLSGFNLMAEARNADIKRQILDIEQQVAESEARRELQITAPRDGRVTGIITLAGQTVGMGTPLLTIVPQDRPLIAQLLAPSSAIGFVREGSPVLLRYEAFPYQRFGQHPARVTLISRANLQPEEITLLNAGGLEAQPVSALYRITVEPDEAYVMAYGQPEPLQAGMQVEAHVLVDTRPLYQWLLEPLYGLRGSIASGGQS